MSLFLWLQLDSGIKIAHQLKLVLVHANLVDLDLSLAALFPCKLLVRSLEANLRGVEALHRRNQTIPLARRAEGRVDDDAA